MDDRMDRNSRLNFDQRKQELEMERLRVGAIENEIEVDEFLFKRYGKTRDQLTQDQIWDAKKEMVAYDTDNPTGVKATIWWFTTKIALPLIALPTILIGIVGGIHSVLDLIAEEDLIGEISLGALILFVFIKIQLRKKSV